MNRRHEAFVRYYLEDPRRSVTRACQRVGLSPGSNDGLDWRLFRRPDIQAAIETGVEGMQREYTTTVDALHDIVAKIMHAQDPNGRGPTGRVLSVADVDRDVMAAIDKIDTYANGRIRRSVFTYKSKQIADLSTMLGLSTAHRRAVNRRKAHRGIIIKVRGVDD